MGTLWFFFCHSKTFYCLYFKKKRQISTRFWQSLCPKHYGDCDKCGLQFDYHFFWHWTFVGDKILTPSASYEEITQKINSALSIHFSLLFTSKFLNFIVHLYMASEPWLRKQSKWMILKPHRWTLISNPLDWMKSQVHHLLNLW